MKTKVLACVSVLSAFLVLSCRPVPSSVGEVELNESKITEGEFVHEHIDGECIKFYQFKYNGHWYIYAKNGNMFHSPDCDCQDENNSSLLLDKPSSIFDW